ncbi:hypothetical protein MTR_6g081030 [Medicago truncatula]|uniref:Uncharacterized protein n=1 Tax=Medicago truncatula TaxID=3880 RepID=G7KLR4_MEDTR|nr:hypothetical protein MTR_6g081030 [Medicago truncatula]
MCYMQRQKCTLSVTVYGWDDFLISTTGRLEKQFHVGDFLGKKVIMISQKANIVPLMRLILVEIHMNEYEGHND